jgi:hypothetical protein
MQRTTLFRVFISAFSESRVGLALKQKPGVPDPQVSPLKVLFGDPDINRDDWIDDVGGHRVFGWHVKPKIKVAPDTKLEASDDVLVCGEVSWSGGLGDSEIGGCDGVGEVRG